MPCAFWLAASRFSLAIIWNSRKILRVMLVDWLCYLISWGCNRWLLYLNLFTVSRYSMLSKYSFNHLKHSLQYLFSWDQLKTNLGIADWFAGSSSETSPCSSSSIDLPNPSPISMWSQKCNPWSKSLIACCNLAENLETKMRKHEKIKLNENWGSSERLTDLIWSLSSWSNEIWAAILKWLFC